MKPQILVVDDIGYIRAFLKKGLESYGMHVDTFSSVEEARLRLRSKKYDIVLLDYYLKYTSGVDALKFVHRFQPDTMTIIITAFPREEMLMELTGYRIYGMVRKPVRIRDLYARIRKMLRDNRTAAPEHPDATVSVTTEQEYAAAAPLPDTPAAGAATGEKPGASALEEAVSAQTGEPVPVPEEKGGAELPATPPGEVANPARALIDPTEEAGPVVVGAGVGGGIDESDIVLRLREK